MSTSVALYQSLKALVRNLAVPRYADQDERMPGINNRGELLVAQALPERVEMVKLGASFAAQIPTASAFTFVNAWPTTRAELILWNGEPAGGRSYVLDRAWLANITSQAAAQPYSLLGQLRGEGHGVAAATDNAAVLRYRLNGRSSGYSSAARLALANTAFMVANYWQSIGNAVISPMTTNLGGSMEVNLFGRVIIPPQCCYGLAGLAGTAAGTAICGLEWHEVQLPSE